MTKQNFIPLNNDLKKLNAFIPSLSPTWRKDQRIKSNPNQIETMDVVDSLKNKGWEITGGWEQREKNRKIGSHFVRMVNPEQTIMKGSKTEAVSQMYISNSCSGTSPLKMELGVYRLVCSNGLVSFDKEDSETIQHTSKNKQNFETIMSKFNLNSSNSLEFYNSLKMKEMTPEQMNKFAMDALSLRFDDNIDPSLVLNSIRKEDDGNDLWSVFNRVQENLTQNDRIFWNGKTLSGINNIEQDIKINKQLHELILQY